MLQKFNDIDTFNITRLIWWSNVADFGRRVVVRGSILTLTRLSPLMGFEGELIEWTSDHSSKQRGSPFHLFGFGFNPKPPSFRSW